MRPGIKYCSGAEIAQSNTLAVGFRFRRVLFRAPCCCDDPRRTRLVTRAGAHVAGQRATVHRSERATPQARRQPHHRRGRCRCIRRVPRSITQRHYNTGYCEPARRRNISITPSTRSQYVAARASSPSHQPGLGPYTTWPTTQYVNASDLCSQSTKGVNVDFSAHTHFGTLCIRTKPFGACSNEGIRNRGYKPRRHKGDMTTSYAHQKKQNTPIQNKKKKGERAPDKKKKRAQDYEHDHHLGREARTTHIHARAGGEHDCAERASTAPPWCDRPAEPACLTRSSRATAASDIGTTRTSGRVESGRRVRGDQRSRARTSWASASELLSSIGIFTRRQHAQQWHSAAARHAGQQNDPSCAALGAAPVHVIAAFCKPPPFRRA